MPCGDADELASSTLRKTLWASAFFSKMAVECLHLLGGSETWCYAKRLSDKWFIMVDIRLLKKARGALRRCVEVMKRDLELAKSLAGKEPDFYWEFRRELDRFLKLLGEANALGAAIDSLAGRRYRLAEIEFSDSWEVEERIADELKRINPDIEVDVSPDRVTFEYRDKKLVIGEASLEELLASAEFVATEEKAVEDVLAAVRKALPDEAKRFEGAVEKLRLFKKLLDQTAK